MRKLIAFVRKNLVLSVCFISFVFMFGIMLGVGAFKKGTFSLDEEENKVIITCPGSFNAGEVIECNIHLSLVNNTTIYSVNANYDFPDDVIYESFGVDNTECTGENCLEVLETTDAGFAVINIDGVTGNIHVGKLRLKMPSTAMANTSYKIGLKEVEISYGDNIEMLDLNDSFATSRVKNNVATLSSLFVTNVTFDETFNSDSFNYNARVSSNVTNLNIGYELTDQNSLISGSIGSISLHYGTNVYNIVVTSEDGKVSNTYKLSIYREYEFNTSRYVYSKDNNYIYTGIDYGNIIIGNLEILSDNLSYSIKDKQLCIIYGGDEELLCINIINFDIEYNIVNKKIYIENNLTYQELLDTITSENIVFKLFDDNGEEVINSTVIINDNYKLKLYYGDSLLDTYTFIKEYLRLDENLIIDDSSMIIKRLKVGTTVGQLKSMFDTSGSIRVTSKENNLSDDIILKSGDKLIITIGNATITYTLSLLGDVTGDGMIDIDDVGVLYRYYRGKRSLENYSVMAGEITSDGIIDIDDVGILYRYYRGKRASLEVLK